MIKVDVPYGAPPATLESAPVGPKPPKPRGRRTLKVRTKTFTGKVVFTPVYEGTDWMIEVSQLRHRTKATAMLSDVARGILFDTAKKVVAAERKTRRKK